MHQADPVRLTVVACHGRWNSLMVQPKFKMTLFLKTCCKNVPGVRDYVPDLDKFREIKWVACLPPNAMENGAVPE